jgi:hypothetical protein
MNKYEHTKFLIERFDHYYDTINNKGAFYIGLNSTIFGGISVGYTSLYTKVECSIWIWLLLISLLVFCFLSIAFTIIAMRPYTKDNHVNDDYHSLVFFGGIAKHEANNFIQKYKVQTEDAINEDMYRQTHCLAKGLEYKFHKLKLASNMLIVQFSIMLPFFFLIIKNLKP